MNKFKFMMWDWDGGEYEVIPKEDLIEALYYAWNYECSVYTRDERELIFSPMDDNEFNSDLLKEYGLSLINGEKLRNFQDIKTEEIFNPPWES
ncbi:hypothetical protein NST33_18085 [Paenibacillus sp. FSL L8-0435]|uniref:hypothetical protein n=1 Tax=Paenibacillus sp. FSL L8-0435 TaxID=2954618 RepID=UPI0030D84E51